jgi:hypothetical protein
MTSKGLRVKERRTELIVEHEGKDLTFVAPASEGGYFVSVRNQLEQNGLRMPTMAETASLVYAAWQNPDNKYSKDIISKLESDRLFTNNGLLYVSNKGVYVVDNPPVVDGRVSLDEEELITKRLLEEDSSVRFVPFGYGLEAQSYLQLAKNPFVKALAGDEGAKKLAEISEKYKLKPYVWSFDNVNKLETMVASLTSNNRSFHYNGLTVGIDFSGLDGYSLGVSDSRGAK